MIDLASLNPPQREAVEHRDGPLLILAGAGSGKTRVITYRIARLIEMGVSPENILAVSFTNKAATEMRERVRLLIPPKIAARCHLSTFHSLGLRMLMEDIHRLDYRRPFTILDESDRYQVLKTALKELGLQGTSSNDARLLQLISKAKNADSTPARLPEARHDPDMPRAQKVFLHYLQVMRNLNAVDFDDLLLLPTRLLREHDDLREKYRARYRYVMVDEYQDTNHIQLRFLGELVGPPSWNLAVVGDDDQSIYGFRGAVADNILGFDKHFPNTRVITLDQNYRSVRSILSAANAVIRHNTERRAKELWSELGDGRAVRSFVLATQADEADFIARRIREQKLRTGRPWKAFAILYRTNPQARFLEESLTAQRVPYRVVGGQSVFDKREIRDTLAWLRLLADPTDELSFRRALHAPPRGIGVRSLQRLDEDARASQRSLPEALRTALIAGTLTGRAREGGRELLDLLEDGRKGLASMEPDNLGAYLQAWIERTGLQAWIRSSENPNAARARCEAIDRFLESSRRARGTTAHQVLLDFIASVTLDPSPREDDEEADADRVTLMTIHASKGLEFPIVYLCGMNEELLPHKHSMATERAISEERRLCYVGMTRARDDLILTRARLKFVHNGWLPMKPSRFLDEIPAQLLQERDMSALQASGNREEELRLHEEMIERMHRLLRGDAPADSPGEDA